MHRTLKHVKRVHGVDHYFDDTLPFPYDDLEVDMSTHYYQERNHDNWTGRVSRQSRITGTWAEHKQQDAIPASAWLAAALWVAVFVLAFYIA